jgi:UrcA family protein
MNRFTSIRTGATAAVLATTVAMAIVVAIPRLAHASTATAPAYSVSQTVKYGDLDLNSSSDAKTLMHRIRVAAHNVCSINGSNAAQELCVERAVQEAAQKVKLPKDGANL